MSPKILSPNVSIKGPKGQKYTKPLAFSAIKIDDQFWLTRDNREMSIKEMTDKHIYATVRMLEKYRATVPHLMAVRMPGILEKYPEYQL